jgi:hypothetical protein
MDPVALLIDLIQFFEVDGVVVPMLYTGVNDEGLARPCDRLTLVMDVPMYVDPSHVHVRIWSVAQPNGDLQDIAPECHTFDDLVPAGHLVNPCPAIMVTNYKNLSEAG